MTAAVFAELLLLAGVIVGLNFAFSWTTLVLDGEVVAVSAPVDFFLYIMRFLSLGLFEVAGEFVYGISSVLSVSPALFKALRV